VAEVKEFLADRVAAAVAAGIDRELIAIDPGIGFGKTVEHNLELIRRLREFKELGRPLLVGPSRKGFIGAILNQPVEERLWGTVTTCAVAVINGADMVRVHDVAPVRQVVDLALRLRR
jgi:dihydropteroate synthase